MTNEEVQVVLNAIAAKEAADKAAAKAKRWAVLGKVAFVLKHHGVASALGAGALYAIQHVL